MFLTPVSLGSPLFLFLSGLTTVHSNQLTHVWLSSEPCLPLLCHQCFSALYHQYLDMLLCFPPFKNRNKSSPLAHIPSGYYPLQDLQWIACVSCLIFLSDPLPGMQPVRVCFLHSSECSQEEGHSAPLSPTCFLQLSLLTWRDHPAACVTVPRTLSFLNAFFIWLQNNLLLNFLPLYCSYFSVS